VGIGGTLAEARRRAGLTVLQVSRRTRLKETVIRSIEDDDYAVCGGDSYARADIRAMALAVGLDPRPLIRQYDETRQNQNSQRAEAWHTGAPQHHHERRHHGRAKQDGGTPNQGRARQYDWSREYARARNYRRSRQHDRERQYDREREHERAHRPGDTPSAVPQPPRRAPAGESATAHTHRSPTPAAAREGGPPERQPERRQPERRQPAHRHSERRRIRQTAMLAVVVLAVLGFASYEFVSTVDHAPRPGRPAVTAAPPR